MQLEECLNFVLTRAQNSIQQLFKAELVPYGVTPGQYAILQCLWDEDGLTAKQLAERLYLDSSTITGMLDRMVNKGLIVRDHDSRDRRALCVTLTEAGKALKQPINQAIEDANKKALDGFSKQEADILKKLLRDLTAENNK